MTSLADTLVENEELAAVNEPLIPTAVNALTVAISDNSESINAPAEVTFEVSVTSAFVSIVSNFVSLVVTLVENDELAAVNEPLIKVAVKSASASSFVNLVDIELDRIFKSGTDKSVTLKFANEPVPLELMFPLAVMCPEALI